MSAPPFLDGSLQWNSALFYYDYQDMQLFTLPPGGNFTRLSNAEKAEVKGFESELEWLPTDGLRISAGVSLLDTENKDPNPDFHGKKLPNAPELTYNATISYTARLSDNLQSNLLLSFNYVDKMYKVAENPRRALADDYSLTNLRWSVGSDKWELAAWIQNLTNEKYVVEIFDQTDLISNYILFFGPPRDYGISLSYRW